MAEGEVGLAKAARHEGVLQMVPQYSSKTVQKVSEALQRSPAFFQLYMTSGRSLSKRTVLQAEALGYKAVVFTVDAPILGRRTRDMRLSVEMAQPGEKPGVGEALRANSYLAMDLQWQDVLWLRNVTKMKIVVKGIHRGDDAVQAVRHGADAVMLSNHGGRQVDNAVSGIDILVDVTNRLGQEGLLHKCEIFVDGGVRSGEDVAKCLALGARAVGFARPVVFALAAYGVAGAQRCLQMVKEQLIFTMAHLGATTLKDLCRDHVVERKGSVRVPVVSRL